MKFTGLAMFLALGAPDPSTEFYYDFRGKDFPHENLRMKGEDAANRIKAEPEGLRITVPAEQVKPGPVGVAARFQIHDDFEITVAYAILHADQPKADWGVGFEIHLMTDTATKEATSFFRVVQTNGSDVYLGVRRTTNKQGKRASVPGVRFERIPAGSKSGRMRVARTGAKVVFASAEGEGQDFRELYRFDLGPEDVTTLQMSANPSNGPHAVDVRITDLRVRAQELVNLADAPAPVAAPPRASSLWILAVLFAVLLVVGGVWIWWKKKGSPALPCTLLAALGLCGEPAYVAADELPEEYYHDFRGQQIPAQLTLFNVNEDKLLQIEPEGARIRIPTTWIHPWGGVGFRTTFGFKGDFEVTTTFEILQADVPPSGYGVGVCLYVAKAGGGGGATVARLVRAGGRQVLLWDNQGRGEGVVPCDDMAGRLCLKRTGTTLEYLFAPGSEGQNFQRIHELNFGTDEIERVRLAVVTGRTPSNVDARLVDLRMRGQFTNMPVFKSKDGLAGALVLGMLITMALVIGLGAWLYLRERRRRSANTVGGETQ